MADDVRSPEELARLKASPRAGDRYEWHVLTCPLCPTCMEGVRLVDEHAAWNLARLYFQKLPPAQQAALHRDLAELMEDDDATTP